MTKIRYIEENDVEDMDMVFSEEEYKDGRLDRVNLIFIILKKVVNKYL